MPTKVNPYDLKHTADQALLPRAPISLALTVWGLAAAFYLFGFFQRVTPGVLTQDLMRDFSLNAGQLGALSAAYYYAYAAVQVPTGLLVERYGARALLILGAGFGAAGAALFALSPDLFPATLGRALIGAAHGVCWVSMLVLAGRWFEPKVFATMSGVSLAVGTLGAILAGPPLRLAAEMVGWRHAIGATAVFALVICVAMILFLKNDPKDKGYRSYQAPNLATNTSLWQDFCAVWQYRNIWALFLIPGGICGCFLTFTGLWGVPFLTQVHGITRVEAAWVSSGMLVAFSVGAIVWGLLSDRFKKRQLPFMAGSALMLLGFGWAAIAPQTTLSLLIPLLILAGFGAGSMVLTFAWAKESVPARLGGVAVGVMNLGVMIGPLTQQPLIGQVLDAHWQGGLINGARVYDVAAFKLGLTVLYGWILVSCVALILARETHAKPYISLSK